MRYLLYFLLVAHASAQSLIKPSTLFPDITHFKLELPLTKNGQDYRDISYKNRRTPHLKNAIISNLKDYTPTKPHQNYFFISDNEMVFRAHAAGALTSPNAYPRCELRQRIDGKDTFWDYQDKHELNVTLRITELPNEKQEVCVVQLKGTNTPNTTSGTSEVLRVEYRQDGNSGWHLEINERPGPKNILLYKLGQPVQIRAHVHKKQVTLEMKNLTTGDTYHHQYQSEFTHGYFKAGAYTQSSIWTEKSKMPAEKPDARSEVRFSKFHLGPLPENKSPHSASSRN